MSPCLASLMPVLHPRPQSLDGYIAEFGKWAAATRRAAAICWRRRSSWLSQLTGLSCQAAFHTDCAAGDSCSDIEDDLSSAGLPSLRSTAGPMLIIGVPSGCNASLVVLYTPWFGHNSFISSSPVSWSRVGSRKLAGPPQLYTTSSGCTRSNTTQAPRIASSNATGQGRAPSSQTVPVLTRATAAVNRAR